jgi:hypothetical protein
MFYKQLRRGVMKIQIRLLKSEIYWCHVKGTNYSGYGVTELEAAKDLILVLLSDFEKQKLKTVLIEKFQFKNEKAEKSWYRNIKDADKDDYYKCIIDCARRMMELIETVDEINAKELLNTVEDELKYNITWHQSGCIAQIVFITHKRGDEFKQSWNESFNVNQDSAYNPAII